MTEIGNETVPVGALLGDLEFWLRRVVDPEWLFSDDFLVAHVVGFYAGRRYQAGQVAKALVPCSDALWLGDGGGEPATGPWPR